MLPAAYIDGQREPERDQPILCDPFQQTIEVDTGVRVTLNRLNGPKRQST